MRNNLPKTNAKQLANVPFSIRFVLLLFIGEEAR